MRPNKQHLLETAQLLARRLERISVDSSWARRSSGTRGNLLKLIEELQADDTHLDPGSPSSQAFFDRLESVIAASYRLLERAAREIPDLDDRHETRP